MNPRDIIKLVLGYALVATLYIAFSDSIVNWLWSDAAHRLQVQLVKGWAFVIVTSLLLAFLLSRIRRAEDTRYRAVFSNHHAVMLLIDPHSGAIVDANPEAERFYGWSQAELQAMSVHDIEQTEPGLWREQAARAMARQCSVFHARHRLADGKLREVEARSGPIERDRAALLLSIISDETARCDAERSLTRLNRLYAMLWRCNTLIVHARDRNELLQGVCDIAVSEGGFLFAWIGMSRNDGTRFPVARSGDDHGRIDAELAATPQPELMRTLKAGGHILSNNGLRAAAGTTPVLAGKLAGVGSSAAFPVLVDNKLVATLNLYAAEEYYFRDEELQTLETMARDIAFALNTIQREAQLQHASAVIEASPAILFRWKNAPRWPVEFVSHNVSRWGYAAENFLSGALSFEDIIHPQDRQRVGEEVVRFLEQGHLEYDQSYRIVTRSGEERWVDDRTAVTRDDDGKAISIAGVVSDVTELRRTAIELNEISARLQLYLSVSPATIYVLHAGEQGLLTDWVSENIETQTGFNAAEAAAPDWWRRHVHPDDRDSTMAATAMLAPGETASQEYRFQHKDGSIIWINDQIRRVNGAIGEPVRYIGAWLDITARRRVEFELRESELRYRQMFRANPHPMWVYDLQDLRFLAVNDAAIRHYGYSESEFLGMTIADIRPAEDVPRLLHSIASSSHHDIEESGIWRHRRKDGALIDVEITSHAFDYQGLRAEIVLANDVTERVRLERERNSAEVKFRSLVEQSLVGVFMVKDERIAYANPRVNEIFCHEAAPGEITNFSDFIDETDHERVNTLLAQLREGRIKSARLEFQGRRRDGSALTVGAQASMTEVDGEAVVIGVVQDITDKAHAEQLTRDYLKHIERSMLGTVDAISQMMDLRDPYTAGHERRVGEIAAAIAAEMGLDESTQRGLRIAGSVHDIGKITVPAEILSRPGRLSPIEYEIIKTHAQQGYEVLKSIDFPWPVAEVARQHHERIDGSGYPRGLRGDEILLEARILAVADVVESMASHRPYRATLGIEVALAEIEQHTGRFYDLNVSAACLRLFRDKGYTIPA
jgi:PAS domain S-box-containing protein